MPSLRYVAKQSRRALGHSQARDCIKILVIPSFHFVNRFFWKPSMLRKASFRFCCGPARNQGQALKLTGVDSTRSTSSSSDSSSSESPKPGPLRLGSPKASSSLSTMMGGATCQKL